MIYFVFYVVIGRCLFVEYNHVFSRKIVHRRSNWYSSYAEQIFLVSDTIITTGCSNIKAQRKNKCSHVGALSTVKNWVSSRE